MAKGMQNNDRPFSQYDQTISPTQEDNGDNGASDRPVPDNGTKNAHFSVGGMPSVTKVDYPLPPDPHDPNGAYDGGNRDHLQNYGLKDGIGNSFDGGFHEIGLASGETKQSGMDDSISGQGFGGASAGGGVDKNTKD